MPDQFCAYCKRLIPVGTKENLDDESQWFIIQDDDTNIHSTCYDTKQLLRKTTMGIFDKIKEAVVNEGGVYILPGLYRCQIQACKERKTRKGIDMIAVELTVFESNNPQRPVGSDMSWVVTFDKDAALGNVKKFVAAVMGIKVEEVDPAGTERIFCDPPIDIDPETKKGTPRWESNPLRGTMIRISANNIKTKAGNDFTLVKWIGDDEGAAAAQAAHMAQAQLQ